MADLELEAIIKAFKQKKESYANTYIGVKFEGGKRYYPLRTRYTEHYHDYIFAYLKPVSNMQLTAFMTLTVPSEGDWKDIERQIQIVRTKWKNARSILAKCGLKKLLYLRSYEIGKGNNFHIHVAFFDVTQQAIFKIALYWHNNVGFQKTYFYTNHVTKYNELTEKNIMYADEQETWLNETEGKVHFFWRFNGEKRVDSKVINYVTKYTVKVPDIRIQALMSYYRIRSFSVSRALQKYLSYYREKFKEENPKEELGEVQFTSMVNVKFEAERLLYLDNEFKREEYEHQLGFNVNQMSLWVQYNRQRACSFYTIELTKAYDERLKFHWYYIVTAYGLQWASP